MKVVLSWEPPNRRIEGRTVPGASFDTGLPPDQVGTYPLRTCIVTPKHSDSTRGAGRLRLGLPFLGGRFCPVATAGSQKKSGMKPPSLSTQNRRFRTTDVSFVVTRIRASGTILLPCPAAGSEVGCHQTWHYSSCLSSATIVASSASFTPGRWGSYLGSPLPRAGRPSKWPMQGPALGAAAAASSASAALVK